MTQRSNIDRNRRWTLAALGSLPVAAGGTFLIQANQNPRDMLLRALSAIHLPTEPASLDLMQLDHKVRRGRHQISAVIRLTWQPGTRQRKFTADGATMEETVASITNAARARYENIT